MVQLAMMAAVLLPYVLPKMHERYLFLADVLAIVYAFYYPRAFFLPVVVGLTSLFSYGPFLFGREIIPLPILAVAPVFTLLFLFYHLAATSRGTEIEVASNHGAGDERPGRKLIPQGIVG